MIQSDFQIYNMNFLKFIKGLFTLNTFNLVMLYRLAHFLYGHHIPLLPYILRAWGVVIFSADISPSARIGKAFRIAHSVGIVIGESAIIGDNFECFQNVTIGGRDREANGFTMPQIGNNVSIFAGACILGPIIIGDNVSVGANSVVLCDIDSNTVVAGVPAKIVNRVEMAHSIRSQIKA